MFRLRISLCTLLTVGSSAISFAQNIEPTFCGSSVPKQATELKSITATLYNIVSGKAGKQREWQLMQDLFAPNARITPIFHNSSGSSVVAMSVNEFIALNEKVFADVNFFETEVASKIYQYGNSATIISQYESRNEVGALPYSTGVNSFQLVNDGRRWCVISVTWDSDKGPYPTSHFRLN